MASSSCGVAAAAPGSFSSAASRTAVAPGRSSESSFSSRQKRPFARSISSESFSAFPVGRSRSISSTSPPNARTAAADPSVEALSSTRISRSTPTGCVASIAARQARRNSRPFVFTTQ